VIIIITIIIIIIIIGRTLDWYLRRLTRDVIIIFQRLSVIIIQRFKLVLIHESFVSVDEEPDL